MSCVVGERWASFQLKYLEPSNKNDNRDLAARDESDRKKSEDQDPDHEPRDEQEAEQHDDDNGASEQPWEVRFGGLPRKGGHVRYAETAGEEQREGENDEDREGNDQQGRFGTFSYTRQEKLYEIFMPEPPVYRHEDAPTDVEYSDSDFWRPEQSALGKNVEELFAEYS